MQLNKLTPGSNLLWEASRMMLPEHKQRIREHQRKYMAHHKPLLDEQLLEQFAHILHEAQENHETISIRCFHPVQDDVLTGTIQTILPNEKKLKLETKTTITWIHLADIIDVQKVYGTSF